MKATEKLTLFSEICYKHEKRITRSLGRLTMEQHSALIEKHRTNPFYTLGDVIHKFARRAASAEIREMGIEW